MPPRAAWARRTRSTFGSTPRGRRPLTRPRVPGGIEEPPAGGDEPPRSGYEFPVREAECRGRSCQRGHGRPPCLGDEVTRLARARSIRAEFLAFKGWVR